MLMFIRCFPVVADGHIRLSLSGHVVLRCPTNQTIWPNALKQTTSKKRCLHLYLSIIYYDKMWKDGIVADVKYVLQKAY